MFGVPEVVGAALLTADRARELAGERLAGRDQSVSYGLVCCKGLACLGELVLEVQLVATPARISRVDGV